MATYVALLRGVNVGGANVLPMAKLKLALEGEGFEDVRTLIASGNVAFSAKTAPARTLEARVERAIEDASGIRTSVMVRSAAQLRAVVEGAPPTVRSGKHRCDVAFLKAPLTPARAKAAMTIREGVDEVTLGPGVVYFSRLKAQITKSRINKIVGTPPYKLMTLRTFATVQKLLVVASTSSSKTR